MPHRPRPDLAGFTALRPIVMLIALCTVTLLASAGCYRHVVSEKGIGRSNETTHEPNLKETDDPVDRLLSGEKRDRDRR